MEVCIFAVKRTCSELAGDAAAPGLGASRCQMSVECYPMTVELSISRIEKHRLDSHLISTKYNTHRRTLNGHLTLKKQLPTETRRLRRSLGLSLSKCLFEKLLGLGIFEFSKGGDRHPAEPAGGVSCGNLRQLAHCRS